MRGLTDALSSLLAQTVCISAKSESTSREVFTTILQKEQGPVSNPIFSRRHLFEQAGHSIGALAAGRLYSESAVVRTSDAIGLIDPLSGWSLWNDVRTYCGFGEHRTATKVDLVTADWLERHLAGLGFQTERQEFTVRQSFVEQTIVLAGRHGLNPVEAFPLWPVQFTSGPISGRLVELRSKYGSSVAGNVALVTFPFSISGELTDDIAGQIDIAAKNGAVAMIGISEGPTGELTAMNSGPSQQPWPIPVVLVGAKDRGRLTAAVTSGTPITIDLHGSTDLAAPATNVIGQLVKARNAPWVVISTPYSGWFRCGGERGPGVALWRGFSRWIASRWTISNPQAGPLNYLFVGTSGHEIGASGMIAFLEEKAPKASDVLFWFHFGAWINSYAFSAATGDQGPQRLRSLNHRFLQAPNYPRAAVAPLLKLPKLTLQNIVPLGEIALILQAGYPTGLSITGRNIPHHTRLDLPNTTGPSLLGDAARAISEFIVAAEQSMPASQSNHR